MVQSTLEPAMSLHLMDTMRMVSLATANSTMANSTMANSTMANSSLASNSMDSSKTASPDTPEARIRETIPCLAKM